MAAPELPIRGLAVLDDDRNFAAAVCKALDRGLKDHGAIEGATAVLLLDTVTPDASVEGRLGVRRYLQRLEVVREAVEAKIAGQPMPTKLAPVPQFLFCDVLMPDYEAAIPALGLRTAERIRDLLTLIYRRWEKAFPSGPEFPFRVQFWSEYWDRLDSRGAELVNDRLTGEPLEWANYRTKPNMATRYDLDGAEIKGLFGQVLRFRSGPGRLPGWLFAGAVGQALLVRTKALLRTSGSCVIVSDSRVARAQVAREFVAISGLKVRSRPPLTTLRQLREQWDSAQDMPVTLVINLTALEYDDTFSADADDLLGWMAPSCRVQGGHRFVFQVEPEDQHWRQLLRKAFGTCEVLVPSPGDRPDDIPRMVQARCGREISEKDSATLKQRAQFLTYEDIDRLSRDEIGPARVFGDEDWDVLGVTPEELLVRLVLSREGKKVSLACDSQSTELTHVGQKQNAWALLCIFAQQRQGAAERLEFPLTEAPLLASELRAQSPRLWQQDPSTQAERRVFDSEGRWQCDFTKDTTGGMKRSLARWFAEIGLKPPLQVSKNGDHIVVEWGYPLAVRLVTCDETLRTHGGPAPRRPPHIGD